jgi:hypothetical protein
MFLIKPLKSDGQKASRCDSVWLSDDK